MKYLKVLIITVLVSLVLTACGGTSNEPQPGITGTPATESQEQETLPELSPEPEQPSAQPSEQPPETQIPDEPSEQQPEPPTQAAALTEDDFSLTINGGKVYFDQPVEEMILILGEDYAYSEAISCAYDGMDKTYGYESVDIYSYPDGAEDYVNEMLIFSAGIETARGISVGAGRDEVILAYGMGKEVGSMLEYELGGHLLSFTFTGDTVSDIDLIRE